MSDRAEMAAYARASSRLLQLIRGERAAAMTGAVRFDRAAAKIAATRSLLARFDDPQRRYSIVHVTGTSGKGSVAAMIAAVLTAAGYRVGLRTSPYLQVATEKLQIGSRLIDAQSLDAASARIMSAGERLISERIVGYSEVWSALTFLWFAEQEVDIAIVEVGSGGRFDATNVFDPVVSVITSVGLDHTASLGPTIADIAWHKAGIIKPGSVAVVGAVPDEAWEIIANQARNAGAPVVWAAAGKAPDSRSLGMPGAFQAANARTAIAAIAALGDRGFTVSEEALLAGLAGARLPGRLERMPGRQAPIVWLDGAHNADKIAAVTREQDLIVDSGPRPVVVLGLLKSKDAAAISTAMAPFAGAIVATEPVVVGRLPLPAVDLATTLRSSGFAGPIHIETDGPRALRDAETLARAQGSTVVVTGSMYLVGQLRGRWYPDEQIVVQRSPWPGECSETDQALPERSVAL